MGRIQCPDCARRVSDVAECCPNCGHPILAVPGDIEYHAHKVRAKLYALMALCAVGVLWSDASDLRGIAILSILGWLFCVDKLRRLRGT